jgi:aldehyde dehydrogenase (NAD+)
MNMGSLVSLQPAYFQSGATRPLSFRTDALQTLRNALLNHEERINRAMKLDLNKSPFEAYMTETGIVLDEIRFHLKHLPGWAKNKRVYTPLSQFHAKSCLSDEACDYIFFTGSVDGGKAVMAAASKHLTPVTLELGGKSPVIVDETANLKLAARRIAFGKVLNAGQTCVAPDYLFLHSSARDVFLNEYTSALRTFFPDGNWSDLPVIISEKHFRRASRLLEGETAAIGGGTDEARRFIEPTVLVDVSPDSPVMQEDICAPILPVMTYENLDECIAFIRAREKPLALYLFTQNKQTEQKILNSCSFGGGCVNDTVIHLANPHLGFGGVGHSGMGTYHGRHSFDTFTHYRSIISKSNWIDLPMRYHPYLEKNLKMIRRLLK